METNMPEQNSKIIENNVIEVDFAKEFKEKIASSPVLKFEDDELKDKILSSNDRQLLVVTSTINSPKLVNSVEYYDKEFLMKVL